MHAPSEICTLVTIAVTVGFSWLAFTRPELEDKCIFDPRRILAGKEYYRLVTSGFLHADWGHLALNMLSLYFFGPSIELVLGWKQFLYIYLGSIIGGNLLSLYVHRHHEYRAYGASGGVCGIIFAYILLWPGSRVGFFIPEVSVPGWLYVILFMALSFYAMKAGRGNVGHDAHLGGAIIGLLITAVLHPRAVRYNWLVFLLVFFGAAGLLVYLWANPMLLGTFSLPSLRRSKTARSRLPKHKQEQLDLDAVLDKVAAHGFESLTEQERALLRGVSGKFQRRSQSKKPDSGLSI